MEHYGATKARLFTREDLASRVINVDDPFGRQLARDPRGRGRLVVTSRDHASQAGAAGFVRATHVKLSRRGIEMEFESSWGAGAITCPLVGDFNVDNLLTVLAVLLDWDLPLDTATRVLGEVRAAPGRMETFGGTAELPLVIVDYAHTPDALSKALSAARAHCEGRLSVVFGCGGDRDPGKRPIMGGIAADLADRIVLTDDNPRTESPRAILEQIGAGIPAHVPHALESDREKAIRAALEESSPGDVVVVAGKGHEDYQIYGHERRHFSDQEVVRAALTTHGGAA